MTVVFIIYILLLFFLANLKNFFFRVNCRGLNALKIILQENIQSFLSNVSEFIIFSYFEICENGIDVVAENIQPEIQG